VENQVGRWEERFEHTHPEIIYEFSSDIRWATIWQSVDPMRSGAIQTYKNLAKRVGSVAREQLFNAESCFTIRPASRILFKMLSEIYLLYTGT
jgi:hypothetical protein